MCGALRPQFSPCRPARLLTFPVHHRVLRSVARLTVSLPDIPTTERGGFCHGPNGSASIFEFLVEFYKLQTDCLRSIRYVNF